MPNVGTASVDLEVDGSRFGRNVRSAVQRESHGITSLFSGIGRAGGSALSAGFSGAVNIVEKLGLATGVAGVALGGFALKVAGDFQQTRIAFEGILGSAEKAEAMLSDLRKFAACVDTETEALTQRGWRRYDELCVGDLVLTLNQSTGQAEWEPVLQMNVYEGVHDVLHVHGQHHDSVSTLNHRWPIYARGLHGDRVLMATSATLREGDRLVGSAPLAESPAEAIYTDEFVELAAWFWTEGSIHQQRVTIAQSERANPEKVARIDRVMEKLFGPRFPGERGTWGRSGPDTQGGITFRIPSAKAQPLLAAAPDRVPTMEFLLALTAEQLELFIAVSLLGDGHVRPQTGQMVLTQKRQDQAERFADAVALSGRRCRVSHVEDGRRWAVSVYRSTPLVGLSHATRTEAQWTRETLAGVVWCPTTPNGTWFARRGGHAYFTGNSTPFEFPELATASKSLLAVGFSANDVIPIMTKLGNVAATLGVGGEAINGVVRALGQMKGKGKASAEELNQISEQIPGFSAVKAIAEKMGVSTADAFKKMEKGAVSADFAIEAILEGMEKFPGAAGAMERQSKTLNGVISTLKDTFRDALIDGIEPFLPAISSGLVKAQPLVKRAVSGLMEAVKDGVQGVQGFIEAFSGEGVTSDGFVGVMERIGVAARSVVDGFKEAWPQIKQVATDVMDRVGAAISNVIGIVRDHWPEIKTIALDTFGSVRDVIDGVVDSVQTIWRNFGEQIVQWTQGHWEGVQTAISNALEFIRGITETVTGILHADWSDAWDGIKAIFTGAWGFLQGGQQMFNAVFDSLVSAGLEVAKSAFRAGMAAIVDVFLGGVEWIIRGAATAFSWVPGVGPKLREAAQKFEVFRDEVNTALKGLERDPTVTLHTRGFVEAGDALDGIRAKMRALDGMTATVYTNNETVHHDDLTHAVGTGGEDDASMPDRAHGMDEGPLPGPIGEPMLVRAHGGEWVLTPEQFESLTSGRSGGSAASGIDAATMQRLVAVLDALAKNPTRAYVVASDVSRSQHESRRR